MKRLLFTFLALCLAVAGSAQSGQMTSKLPTIDITKEYPKKKLVLQDIATAEYIPLETSDKVSPLVSRRFPLPFVPTT